MNEFTGILNKMRENNGLSDENIIKLMQIAFKSGVRQAQIYVSNEIIRNARSLTDWNTQNAICEIKLNEEMEA